jgi:hypothetical protein
LLRRHQLLSHSRTSQHFMESEGSLPCSHEHTIGLYILKQINSVYIPHPISLNIHFNIIFPFMSRSSSWRPSFRFSYLKPCALLFSPIHTSRRARFILDLIIVIILGEEYKLRSSSLCSFLQPPANVTLNSNANYWSLYFFQDAQATCVVSLPEELRS